MAQKVVKLPPQRLRAVDEARLIERPLAVRRSVIFRPWPRKAGAYVWIAGLLAVMAFFALGG